MTLYRFAVQRNLFDTGVRNPGDLDYKKADGSDWPISEIDYNLLDSLSNACIGRTFIATDDLDARAQGAALAALQTELIGRNESVAGWEVIVNSSQPSGGIWDDTSLDRWIHFTKTESSVDGIAASPYASVVNGQVVTTWRVISIKAVVDT